ncbi:MAG: nucleotidyltransferase family protein [Paracoccaceae bacterium]
MPQVVFSPRDQDLAYLAPLLVPAQTKVEQRLDPARITADDVARFARLCWQISPQIVETAQRLAGTPADTMPEDVQTLTEAAHAITRLHRREVSRLAETLTGQGVEHCLMKGAALRESVYPPGTARAASDIDIAVRHPHLDAAVAAVAQLGYAAAEWSDERGRYVTADPDLRRYVEAHHHELGFIVRYVSFGDLTTDEHARYLQYADIFPVGFCRLFDDSPGAYLSLDVHHGISLDMSVDLLIDSAAPSPHSGVLCPSDPVLVFHTIFKIYWEGVHHYGTGLYQYADLLRIVPSLDRVALDTLEALLTQHHLRAAGYYVLRRLDTAFGALPRNELSEMLDRLAVPADTDCKVENDLGDMWPKLWGGR